MSQQESGSMNQPFLIIGLIVAAILVFGATFSFVRVMSLEGEIASLESQIAVLEQSASVTSPTVTNPGSGSDLRRAVVRVNYVGEEYQKIPAVLQQLQDGLQVFFDERGDIEQRYQQGLLTDEEYGQLLTDVNNRQAAALVELLARPIQNAVNTIAQQEGYHIVYKVEDVILFSQGGVLTDITDQVLQHMIDNRR